MTDAGQAAGVGDEGRCATHPWRPRLRLRLRLMLGQVVDQARGVGGLDDLQSELPSNDLGVLRHDLRTRAAGRLCSQLRS